MKLLLKTFFLLLLVSVANAEQICSSNALRTIRVTDYSVSDTTGEVFDGTTGLVWAPCPYGMSLSGNTCIGTAIKTTWVKAISYTESATDFGHNDWRLPNIKELATIIEWACSQPALNEDLFKGLPLDNVYWSNTPIKRASGVDLFTMDMTYGEIKKVLSTDNPTAYLIMVRER